MNEADEKVIAYHEQSKNLPNRYARAPGFLDWANQPDPFRCYLGAPCISLIRPALDEHPWLDELHRADHVPSAQLSAATLGQLLYDSMALSAWKVEGGASRPLRCAPSAGGLHPTEAYLLCGVVSDLTHVPALYHYNVFEHKLELRGEQNAVRWLSLCNTLPADATLFIGLTSIHWRTTWKYGERAYRYCQLELGHALGALAYAAAALGWCTRVLPLADADLAALLGIAAQTGPDAEWPGCLVAVFPQPAAAEPEPKPWRFEPTCLNGWQASLREEIPNSTSPSYREWPIIDETAEACRELEPIQRPRCPKPVGENQPPRPGVGVRRLLRQRRSALNMDGESAIELNDFLRICRRLWPGKLPFCTLGSGAALHILFFVHRVNGLPPGYYILPRSKEGLSLFKELLLTMPEWSKPEGVPPNLPLYALQLGDAQTQARVLSGNQAIASSGAFAVSMLAEFEHRLDAYGPGEYRRLHWEAGLIGQALYIEAQATGLSGTAIGTFLDDSVHRLLGIPDRRLQVLYNFSVGGPVEDTRVTALPAYHHLERPAEAVLSV